MLLRYPSVEAQAMPVASTANETVSNFNETIHDIIQKLQEAERDIKENKKEIQDLTSRLSTAENEIRQLSTQVSFSAVNEGLFEDFTTRVSSDTDIVFNKALVNVGGGYNTTTGVFTCPIAGRYFINYDFQVKNLGRGLVTTAAVGLLLNGGRVTRSQTALRQPDADVIMGAGLVLQLQQGDKLNVRTAKNWPGVFCWSWYGYSSMFSGFLLK